MRSRSIAIIVALVLGVSGCGVFYWGKPGTTKEQFERDSNECAKEAMKNVAAQVVREVFDEGYKSCLKSRGYVREQKASQESGWYRGIE